jgi:hypothetical protein
MSDEEKTRQREEILNMIRGSLQKSEKAVEKYRRLDASLLITSIALGALSTTLAGGIAVAGEPAASALDVPNVASGWQIVCVLVAICAAVATISGSVHKSFRITENLASAIACSSALKFLELSVTFSGSDVQQVVGEYSRLLREYATVLA